MSVRTNQEIELESLALDLIAKYPSGYLAKGIEMGWPCKMAIRVPEPGRPAIDTPRVILEGSYQELRAFENIYNRLKEATSKPNTLLQEAYWQSKERARLPNVSLQVLC
jgi:hypothetical protein